MRHVLLALLAASLLQAQSPEPTAHRRDLAPPPAVPREFRGVWVTTVNNSDWPSKPWLSTWEQQRELVTILDEAVALRLNAVVFHARTGADAFYDSPYEPWAQFLTGVQGRAPEPYWDPLRFVVDEAHRRGLEVHAWFNPYKAHYTRDTAAAARTHVVKAHPELSYPYGHFVWMDPGIPEVRRRAVRAILDVTRRYDVDGVHIDDFFYPYPEKDSAGRTIPFPDSATYARYRRAGGRLALDDWRRHNVDLFVKEFYTGVKRLKPWVKVGVSPFGIWRPGRPATITGFDAYAQIYADSRKWLREGWVDYLAPQLYWAVDPPAQSFPVLLDWWTAPAQNPLGRHIWPGLFTGRVDARGVRHWPATEIVRQVELTRERAARHATGVIHFPTRVFLRDPDSLDEKLSRVYAEPALAPASPWLGHTPPARPSARLTRMPATGEPMVRLAPARGRSPWLWTVRARRADGTWSTSILPGREREHRLADADSAAVEVIVTAVDRLGNESRAVRATRDRR